MSRAPTFAEQNVVVVIDDSGSMDADMWTASGQRIRRIDAAKQALVQVLGDLPPETNVGVLALNTILDGSNWLVELGPATAEDRVQQINQLRAEGGTPLGEFLKQGADALLQARDKQLYGTYRLLIVSDGEANDPDLVEAYLPQILARGIVVDVIGVDMSVQHSLATRVHNYRSANDESALTSAISEVFAETLADDGMDGDAAFDMLKNLPDEFASEAIQVLTNVGNLPLDANASSSNNSGWQTNAGTGPSDAAVGFTLLGGLCCFFMVGFTVIVIALIVVGRNLQRRR
ncbi:MAG: VWA domain-containing protein [Planctomycetales bacterium]|nr:VWA domain-containing protein [Planctomycetales bacterium]